MHVSGTSVARRRLQVSVIDYDFVMSVSDKAYSRISPLSCDPLFVRWFDCLRARLIVCLSVYLLPFVYLFVCVFLLH